LGRGAAAAELGDRDGDHVPGERAGGGVPDAEMGAPELRPEAGRGGPDAGEEPAAGRVGGTEGRWVTASLRLGAWIHCFRNSGPGSRSQRWWSATSCWTSCITAMPSG